MNVSPEKFSLQDLAEITQIEGRTIRHYISLGLLPPPLSKGREAKYDTLHKKRLEQIVVLKRRYKLEEIRQLFQERSDQEIEQILEDSPQDAPNSASQYLNSISEAFKASGTAKEQFIQRRQALHPSGKVVDVPQDYGSESVAPLDELLIKLQPKEGAAHISSRSAQPWYVIEIIPGIEMHIRNPSRVLLARLERACDYIRHLLKGAHHG